ncbi:MAG: sigma-70 family RNA polymerase sigma factor [Pirellulaceae bacterium]
MADCVGSDFQGVIAIVSEWAGHFATTQWTLVWNAAKEDPQAARPAFAELFERYRQPLYFVARRQGLSQEDAEDAIQDFFTSLLDDSFLGKANPVSGRFRNYLGIAWKRFLIDDYRRGTTEKRGGHVKHLTLDVDVMESAWLATRQHTSEVDRLFAKTWAENVLASVRERLATEYTRRGRGDLFAVLIAYVSTPLDTVGYAALATQLATTEGAVKVALHRLRRRFGETLRDTIAETVASPADIDAELDELLAALT